MDNEMKFDPNTGKPIEPKKEAVTSQELQQSTANVGQSEEQFINNTSQVSNEEEPVDKTKAGIKLIIIFFIIMILFIIFVFPLLNKL